MSVGSLAVPSASEIALVEGEAMLSKRPSVLHFG